MRASQHLLRRRASDNDAAQRSGPIGRSARGVFVWRGRSCIDAARTRCGADSARRARFRRGSGRALALARRPVAWRCRQTIWRLVGSVGRCRPKPLDRDFGSRLDARCRARVRHEFARAAWRAFRSPDRTWRQSCLACGRRCRRIGAAARRQFRRQFRTDAPHPRLSPGRAAPFPGRRALGPPPTLPIRRAMAAWKLWPRCRAARW